MKHFSTSLLVLIAALAVASGPIDSLVQAKPNQKFAFSKSEAQWQKKLGPAAYDILRKSGTERPYSGKLWDHHEVGTYICAGCDLPLFSSTAKFDSETGWPSFFREMAKGRTLVRTDKSDGMIRSEIICSRCGGHLGHVFDDGPAPTKLRYCLNSPALKFTAKK